MPEFHEFNAARLTRLSLLEHFVRFKIHEPKPHGAEAHDSFQVSGSAAGLLLAAPMPDLGAARASLARAVPVAAGVIVVAGLLLGGLPIWSHTGHGGPVTLRDSPAWKLDTESLDDVRILADSGVSGEVLLPPRRMKVLTMYTVEAFPVVPREWFIENIDEPVANNNARRVLYQLASGELPLPNKDNSAEALELLGVDLACTGESPNTERVMKYYAAAGYTETSTYGTLSCARRPA